MSEDTIVLDRDNRYKMLGAQNLNGITCFLNATLFAMFCRSDSCFDKLLYSALDGPVGRFATMVRLWVNMLRSGWFISSDIVAVSLVPQEMLILATSRELGTKRMGGGENGPTTGRLRMLHSYGVLYRS